MHHLWLQVVAAAGGYAEISELASLDTTEVKKYCKHLFWHCFWDFDSLLFFIVIHFLAERKPGKKDVTYSAETVLFAYITQYIHTFFFSFQRNVTAIFIPAHEDNRLMFTLVLLLWRSLSG